ncbi:OmpA family protein [Alicyclobacillus tolerans]|uniref:OmpA/MotB family protein n=1 Tax=Alicyclobacillus tolerans TaxID=90970 RepID=UPI001F1CF413|nr:flagellar motor protein MotB [Alicyclobacillus tolerans]MCF8567482.1 OmpA family protein [Alicyclobacillus tolerans]
MRRHRKVKSQGHSSTERWLLTYSDLITLLMVFFVILFAMSKINEYKFNELKKILAVQFHGQTSLLNAESPSNPVPLPKTASTDQQQLNNLYTKIQQYIQRNHLQNKVSVYNEPRGVQITFRDVALFDTGSAQLLSNALPALKGIAPFFNTVPNTILVEGYTDNQPIHTAEFPSNWQLSASRAISVLQFLQGQNINPNRMAAVGYGQYHPVAPNDTSNNRQLNRRVNIVVLKSGLAFDSHNGQSPNPVSSSKGVGTRDFPQG